MRTWGLGLVVGVAVLVGGCSGAAPRLIPDLSDSPPDPSKGIDGVSFSMPLSVFSVEPDTYPCSVRNVRVTSLTLYHATSGIRLARWGIANENIPTNGEADGPLDQLGPFPSKSISQRCHVASEYSRIGLELHRTQPGTQSFLGLRLTYDSGGSQGVAYLWEQFRFCDKPRSTPCPPV